MSKIYYTETHQAQYRRIIPDLIRSRETLVNLVLRELRVRYRFAVMGFLWVILEPLMLCLVLTFVFSFVFEIKSFDESMEGPRSFAALMLCALIPWQFFSDALRSSTGSLVEQSDLVGKVYFPREVVPLSTVGVATVNFFMGFVVLLLFLVVFGIMPTSSIVWVPVIFAIQFVLVCGSALFLSCAYVHFRDVRYMVHVALMFGFYATPIFYSPQFVQQALERRLPDALQWLYYLYFINPLVGIVTAYREALVYHNPPSLAILWWPALVAVTLLVVGAMLFRRRAGSFADYI